MREAFMLMFMGADLAVESALATRVESENCTNLTTSVVLPCCMAVAAVA